MPFKKKEDGSFALDDKGNLIFVRADGKEEAYDVDVREKLISDLSEKSGKRARELEELKSKYKILEGIEDLSAFIEKARKDAETVNALPDKERESEAAIQKRIAEALKSAVAPLQSERDLLKGNLEKATKQLEQALIGNAFATSKFAAEKISNLPLARKLFVENFSVKDGKIIGHHDDGKEIWDNDELAGFDKALERLIDASDYKEVLVNQSPGGSGTDSGGNNHGSQHNTKERLENMPMEDFFKERKGR